MNTEIYIENYRLDVSADISSLLNFAIDDIKEFSSRSTTWSKTIVLPGTANNNKLFGHIFNVGHANQVNNTLDNVGVNYNAAKSADCLIFQDQIQTFKGVLRLMQINIIKGGIEYEVAVFGELAGLNVALSSGKLEDLDFSAYNHTYNVANIVASWANTVGLSYYYPLIDYGLASTLKHDWDFRTFRPSLHVREYIDKMITDAGYRWECDLFDTARFKTLIVPHNQKNLQALSSRLLSASRNNAANVIDSGTPAVVPLEFSSVATSIFTDTLNISRFTYNGAAPTNLILNISFTGTYIANVISFTMALKKNGVVVAGTTQALTADGTNNSRFYSWTVTDLSISLTTNDYIELVFTASSSFGSGQDRVRATNGNLFVDSITAVPVDVNYNDGVVMNDILPKNIRQIDFLTSIIKLFNLYVYEDKFDSRLIYFKPYIDFYSTDSTDSVDWTYKMNRDKAIKIRPMSELNAKLYYFKYKPDADYYGDLYRKRYNEGYGDYVFDSAYEFSEQSKSLELVFSATALVGITGEDKLFSTIFKQTNGLEENIDSNIRILQSKKITGVSSWDILDGASVLSSETDYGYAGHLNDPDAPSDDLNFGALRELFFVLATGNLSATQFNVYWSSYMAEITDKDSKLLSGFFKLTTKDILDLDFSKKVFVDGNLFRLNAIKDYNVSEPNDCEIEIMKINYLIY